jgi:hypothetical protein
MSFRVPNVFHFDMKEGSIVPEEVMFPKREILPDPLYNSILVTSLSIPSCWRR